MENLKIGDIITLWGTGCRCKVLKVDPDFNPPKWAKLQDLSFPENKFIETELDGYERTT